MTRRRAQNDIFGLCQRPAVRKRGDAPAGFCAEKTGLKTRRAGVLAGGPRLSKAKAGQAKTSAPVGRRARFHRRRRCPAWSLRAVACRAVCPARECPCRAARGSSQGWARRWRRKGRREWKPRVEKEENPRFRGADYEICRWRYFLNVKKVTKERRGFAVGAPARRESGRRVWEKRKAPAFAGLITSLRRPTFLALRK